MASRGSRRKAVLAFALVLALDGGCATARPRLAVPESPRPGTTSPAATPYSIACPDVLDVSVAGRPDLTGRVAVEPDGAIGLGDLGRLPAEGLTTAELAGRVAAAAGVSRAGVRVRVAEFNSRQVFLFGPVSGPERAVPYRGPETVTELLQRTGGLTRAAEIDEIHVVRANVAVGRRPEVFPVDLGAIRRGDARTDVPLQPYDQIYVGETRRYSVGKYLPRWMRFGRTLDD